jgi:hypothetical protein
MVEKVSIFSLFIRNSCSNCSFASLLTIKFINKMKKLILVIAALSFAAIVSAQSSVTTPAASTTTKPATAAASATPTAVAWYGCPKCDFTAQKDGKCPTHNVALIKDHSYFCPKEGTVSDKAGKCTDGTAMIMMDCKVKMMNVRKAGTTPVPAIK